MIYKDTVGDYILNVELGSLIPKDLANKDYAQFKKAINEGAELQDADGNVMSAEEVKAYIATLP